MEILERRRKEREEVIARARQYALGLPFKCSVMLVGSYARGDFNLWSGVDILVVGAFSSNPVERYSELDFPPGFEVIPIREEEFHFSLKAGNPLIAETAKIGVILRDDYNLGKLLKIEQ
jgi:predicted nucleotidyltransferase